MLNGDWSRFRKRKEKRMRTRGGRRRRRRREGNGVAALQLRGLRSLPGEAQVPLPGLPRALVSGAARGRAGGGPGRPRDRGRAAWGPGGRGAGGGRRGAREPRREGGRLWVRRGPRLTPARLLAAARWPASGRTEVSSPRHGLRAPAPPDPSSPLPGPSAPRPRGGRGRAPL